MERQPERKYQIWSNAIQTGASVPGSKALGIEPDRSVQNAGQRGIVLSAIQRADLYDLKTSMIMYGYGLPLDAVLEGVCTLPSGVPAKCKTSRISSETVDVELDLNPLTAWFMPRERLPDRANVHLKLKEVGAVSGAVTSQNRAGFRVSVDNAQRSELGAKLVAFAAKRGIGSKSPIGYGSIHRLELHNKSCNYIDHTNTLRRGAIVSLSRTDVLIRATIIPPIRANISFRGPRRPAAEVVNTYEIGFVAKFVTEISKEEFSAELRLSDL